MVTYFPSFGRGEYVRMALVLSKVSWKDVTVNEDWIDFKPKTPNGYMPKKSYFLIFFFRF